MSDNMVHGEAADFFTAEGWHWTAIAAELGITADTSDEEINAIAATAFAEAREQGQIVSGIYSYLVSLRDQLRNA